MSKRVVMGVTGSIAAYKAAELVRLMKKRGWDVRVVMTRCAREFVGEITFRTLSGHVVACDMFDPNVEWDVEHVALSEQADVLVIAPCTANVLAKLAHGIADDLLTCTALACESPLVIAPAMNTRMWRHAATQANVKTLKARGAYIVDVEAGDLACGTRGQGRLAELDVIMAAIESRMTRKGKKQ